MLYLTIWFSLSFIIKWELGKYLLSLSIILKIANFQGVGLSGILISPLIADEYFI